MNRLATQPTRRAAFTLVEVLVASGLGVAVLLALQALLVNSYRTSVTLEQRAARAAVSQLPFELLQQDLESLPVGSGFRLADATLSFTTLNALHSTRVAARHTVVAIYVLDSDYAGRPRIRRREQELGTEITEDPGVILADNLQAASLSIFDGSEWHTSWPLRTPRRARAVRLRVVSSSGQKHERIIQLTPLRWRRHDD